MRIAHVVTYVSEDGAFGGPVAVAIAQTAELVRRGHVVDLLAGWDGRARLPNLGVTHRLFPVRSVAPGFSGLIAPGLTSWLARKAQGYDIIHVHLARDLITLSSACLALALGRRLTVQPHGMIKPDTRARARIVDLLATRSVLRRASAVLALTEEERARLVGVVGGPFPTLRMIPNGVPIETDPNLEREEPPVVMFLARLHPRKRVLAFAEAARTLINDGCAAKFEIFGPDEGDLLELQTYIAAHTLGDRVVYRGAVPQGRAREELRRASVYVLPSVGEVFPMTVLEALSVGTPAVFTSDCGSADELARRGAAIVTDGTPRQVAGAIDGLLAPGGFRAEHLAAAGKALRDCFSIEAVGAVLESVYKQDSLLLPGSSS